MHIAEGLPLWQQAHCKVVGIPGLDAAADLREQLDDEVET